MTVAGVRIPHARLIVAAASVIAATGILWLSRSFNFYFDEWTFILSAPDWTWVSYLVPHNEHPSMLLRLIYAGLLSTVGLRSYVPYMVILVALHATTVMLLFELVRRRAGDLVGVGAAALLLVLGAGWEDLLWAFQIAWVGSLAFGLGMLLALESSPTPRRLFLAATLLTGSLMFSGIGLLFGITAAVRLAAAPGRRRDMIWLLPVAIALGVWYLAFGRSGAPTNPPPSAANVIVLPLYALWGLGSSAAGLIGEGGPFALPMVALAAVAVGFTWRRRGADPFAVGVAAGLVGFYVITGLTRAQLGYQQSGAGRYVYVGAVFWLLLLADAARDLPWRGTWRPALIACLFLACFNSSVLLSAYAFAKSAQMGREVADFQALAAERGDPCLRPNAAVDPLLIPPLTDALVYYRAIDRYGDPSAGLPITDHVDFDRARSNLVSGSCR